MKQTIRAVLQKSALAKLVDAWGQRQLVAQPVQELDPSNLKSSASLSLDEVFSNPATATRWEADHAAIKAVFGEGDQYGGINPGDRRALYYLVGTFKPERVLEIGTHIGASTLYLARAMRSIGRGIATSVDVLDVNAPDGPWKKAGLSSPPKDLVRRLECSDHVEFMTQASLDVMKAARGKFDFIFLDGDHSAKAVYLELAAALPILRPEGVILLHDYYPNGKPLFPDRITRTGPYRAMQRVQNECPAISVEPLGELPWPTKQGTNVTSLALVTRS